MRIHFLQHEPFECPAAIEDWADEKNFKKSFTHLYKGDELPRPYEIDYLVLMGGSMNIYEYDKHPWLRDEKNFIAACVDKGVKTIGICLGAQLIADVLGGRVTRNAETEIGWFPIHNTPDGITSNFFKDIPETYNVMHWHGDTFSIPPGCKHLAKSEACENQAFSFEEHVLGLQFHLEFKHDSVDKMLENCDEELIDAPYIQKENEIRNGCAKNIDTAVNLQYKMLDNLLAL